MSRMIFENKGRRMAKAIGEAAYEYAMALLGVEFLCLLSVLRLSQPQMLGVALAVFCFKRYLAR